MTNKKDLSDGDPRIPLDTASTQLPLLDQMRELQGKADTIGPVDPDFSFKDYSSRL